MKVLVADKFPASGVAALTALGLNVEVRADVSAQTLPATLAETRAEILVVRSTEVRAAAFEAAPDLSLVVRAGAGVNTIDQEAASRRGVFVTNCPGKNAIAVAELAMALLLALDRRIPDAVASARAGTWDKKKYSKADGLAGRTLGLVGFGSIAREVAKRARAFDLEVLAFSPSLTEATAKAHGVLRAASLADLLARADAISVHTPYNKTTHHLIGAAELASLRDGAMVIHTSRGGVIDDAALAAEVAKGRLRAAVDVLEGEPEGAQAALDHALARHEGAYVTPHVGASTEQAQQAIADEVVRIIKDFVQQGIVHHCVNLHRERGSSYTVVVRHLDHVGVLAAILSALREENLNVQDMQNVIFRGNHAANATITLAGRPSDAVLDRLRAHPDVLAISVRG